MVSTPRCANLHHIVKLTVSCSRLPVRALLFLCPVCQHGGHQTCYQQYHLSRPLIQLSSPQSVNNPSSIQQSEAAVPDPPKLRRAASKTGDGEGSDDGASTRDGEEGSSPAIRFPEFFPQDTAAKPVPVLSGHPCAAGCGHFCWATNDPLLHESVASDP